MGRKSNVKILMEPLFSLLLAFLVGTLVVALIGQNPLKAFGAMFSGAFGTLVNLGTTLSKTTVLTLTGLSYAFAFRCGLCNIGAEGQLYIGALCSSMVVLKVPGPAPLVIVLALAAGFLGGALMGLLVGVLKVRFGANEVITTVMMNYVAALLVQWAVCGPLQAPNSTGAETVLFDSKYWLPVIISGTKLHIGFPIMILCLIFFGVFLWKTRAGFGMTIVGQNKIAASFAGIDVEKNILLSMFLAGGFAGLGGAIEVLGVQHRLLKGMASNYGFDGIAVALLGGNTPVGMLFAGVLMGAMKNGGNSMQMFTGVPSSVVDLIRALVIVFVLINVLPRIMKSRNGNEQGQRINKIKDKFKGKSAGSRS